MPSIDELLEKHKIEPKKENVPKKKRGISRPNNIYQINKTDPSQNPIERSSRSEKPSANKHLANKIKPSRSDLSDPSNTGTIPELYRNQTGTEVILNRNYTGTIPEPNRNSNKIENDFKTQSKENAGTKSEFNRNYTGTEVILNRNQNGTISEPNQNYTGTGTGTKTGTIPEQRDIECIQNIAENLPKKEALILNYLCYLCMQDGRLRTPKLQYFSIGAEIESSSEVTRKLCTRLIKKGLLIKIYSKKGPSGFLVFEIPQTVYHFVLRKENSFIGRAISSNTIPEPNRNYTGTGTGTGTGTKSTSKLDSNKNNISNSSSLEFSIDDLNWEKLKEVKVYRKQIGDSLRNINHLEKKGELTRPLVSQEDFQDFIDAFYSYAHSPSLQGVRSTSGFFCQEALVLQKTGTCQSLEHNKDMQELAYEEFVEKLKLKRKKKNETEENAIHFAISDWSEEFTQVEFKELIPLPAGMTYGSEAHNSLIYEYFKREEWPKIKSGIRKKTTQEIKKENEKIENEFEIVDPEF